MGPYINKRNGAQLVLIQKRLYQREVIRSVLQFLQLPVRYIVKMSSYSGLSFGLSLAVLLFFSIKTPFVLGDEECQKKSDTNQRLADQDFGMAITPDDFLFSTMMSPMSMMTPWMFRDYIRPWRHLASITKDLGSTIKTDKDKFQINLDVQHFSPDEITVKTAEGYVVIEAKHEEKKDEHGYISRQFIRRYALPEGTEPESIVSQLSSDGVLTVTAPRKPVPEKEERVVPISQTGPVRKEPKENPKVAEEGSCQSEKCSQQ